MKFAGSIDEKELMKFISFPNKEKPGKFDVAIVKPDGTVKKIDEEVIVDQKSQLQKAIDQDASAHQG